MLRRSPVVLVTAAVVVLTGLAAALAQPRPERPRRQPPRRRPMPPNVKALPDLEYAKVGKKSLLLDLYVPKDARSPCPLVVWVHGGAWRGGSRARCPALGLTRSGFAAASISYRLSQEAIWPAQIHDCKAAIRYLRANAKTYNIDPDRIGVWGSSAGGHLVAMLGTSGGVEELEGEVGITGVSSRVQAVCDWFGPTDFCKMSRQLGDKGRINHDAAGSPESLLVGGPIQENKDKVRSANPITHVSKDDPPFLIMHGEDDVLVPHQQSGELHEALKKAGVDSTLQILKGQGHGFRDPQAARTVAEFFGKHLKSPAKPATPERDAPAERTDRRLAE